MKLICVGSIILIFGCGTNTKIIGTYSHIGNPDFIELKADGTFKYKYAAFHVSQYSTGNWKKGPKNNVILNSTIKSKIVPLKVVERQSSNGNYLNINIESSDTLGGKDYKCEVFINDTLYALNMANQLISTHLNEKEASHEININNIYFRYVRCDSLRSTSLKFPIKSIYFKILKQPFYSVSTVYYNEQLITDHYFLKSNVANELEFNISINDSLFQYKIFDNVDIKVKSGGIYIEQKEKNKLWIPRSN